MFIGYITHVYFYHVDSVATLTAYVKENRTAM